MTQGPSNVRHSREGGNPGSLDDRWSRRLLRVFLIALLLGASPASAESGSTPLPGPLREIGIDQNLGRSAPMEAEFRDETGKTVELGDYFGELPVLLSLVYFECPMLCTMTTNGVIRALRALDLRPGKDFRILTVSFNPAEQPELAARSRTKALKSYQREGGAEGWHFLTGPAASIDALTSAVGFRYAYDEKTRQFAHASALVLLTPDGRLSRYFYGVEYSARDIQLGLIEASKQGIGTLADEVLLFCYKYDPATGKYGLAVMRLVRFGGMLTLLALATFVVKALRREKAPLP